MQKNHKEDRRNKRKYKNKVLYKVIMIYFSPPVPPVLLVVLP
jgi:hypothetical protein